jgi:hypothetical protein
MHAKCFDIVTNKSQFSPPAQTYISRPPGPTVSPAGAITGTSAFGLCQNGRTLPAGSAFTPTPSIRHNGRSSRLGQHRLQPRPKRRRLPHRNQQPSGRRRQRRPRLPTRRARNRATCRAWLRQHPRPPQRNQPLQPRANPTNPPPNRYQQHRQSPLARGHHRNGGLERGQDAGEIQHARRVTYMRHKCQ